MRSPSLDYLYVKINKHIALVQSYSEIDELTFVIKTCRLKPHDYLFGDKNTKLVLHTWWFDEYGNSIKIINKKLNIIYNDLQLNRDKIICTDLYYGLPIDKIIKMSKLAFIYAGKDEDLLQDCLMIAFLGIDNYIRNYIYLYDEWQQVSPLLLGFNNLKTISKNLNIKNFLKLKIKEMPMPCLNANAWLTCLPVKSNFLHHIDSQYDIISHIFYNKKDQ